jgi:hypothetical protein
MPVYILKEEMPYNELLRWIEFFHKRPIGWQEDQRTYLLLKAQGVKESGENLFPSLKAIKENTNKKLLQEPDRAVPKGEFLKKMLAARDGDNLNWRQK